MRLWGGLQSKAPRTEVILLLVLLAIYNINLRQVSSVDTYASRYVPISMLRDGRLALDEFFPGLLGRAQLGEEPPIYLTTAEGHFYDAHPIVAPLLALPIYALPVWLGIPSNDYLLATLASKVSGSLMAAISALLVFATVRRLMSGVERADPTSRRPNGDTDPAGPARETGAPTLVPLLTAIAYALSTSVWSTASQAIWSHSAAIFCWALALWALVSSRSFLAGVATAAAVLARPATGPAAVVFMVFALHSAWRQAPARAATGEASASWAMPVRYAAGLFLVGVMGAVYNLWLFGTLAGGLPVRAASWLPGAREAGLFATPVLVGLAGLTVSPSRGILFFSPIVMLAGLGAVHLWSKKARSEHLLLGRYASLAALSVVLVYAKFTMWWGGHGFGPRYLTDVMPFLGFLMAFGLLRLQGRPYCLQLGRRDGDLPAIRAKRWPGRVSGLVLSGLLAYSVFVQAVGAFCWPSPWTLDKNPRYHERLWEWRNNQILWCIRAGPRLDPTARRLLLGLGLPVDPVDPYRHIPDSALE